MERLHQFVTNIITQIIDPLLILLVTAGVAYFIWGVAMYLVNAEKPEERKKAQKHMIWGIVGIVIMVAVRSILEIVVSTFDVSLPY
ncbi:MAG: hypothetical protein RLZZ283_477 [Candidatus Parcubacteria bacterium]|jgi:uncharacterized membrane protein YidH (DUF202 family)